VKRYRLSAEAHHLVTRELASGQLDRHPPAAYQDYLEDAEVELDLDAFDGVVEHLLATTPARHAGFDRLAAPALHRALPLTRREASLPGVWRYLTTVRRPELVRHRWGSPSWTTTRAHYWSPGTRPDSNAICRLWWIAELTHQAGGSYDMTQLVLERQPLATQLFVRSFSRHRETVVAFVRVLGRASSEDIERVARQFYGRLSTLVLEAMTSAELESLLRELLASSSAE
jgi:Family of unknown function (DUF6339)